MRRLLVLSLSSLSLVLAGCGGSGGAGDDRTTSASPPKADVKAATAQTKAATTLGFKMTMRTQTGARQMRVPAEGVMDLEEKTFSMSMDLTDISPRLGRIDAVGQGSDLYVSIPAFEEQLREAGSKRWIKSSNTRSSFANPGGDPKTALEGLEALDQDPTEVGSELLHGVKTTHYRTRLDVEAMAASAKGQKLSPSQRASLDALRQAGQESIPVEVWIGEDGYVHRFLMTFDLEQEGQQASVEIGFDFFDFNEPVEIEIPQASETMTEAELKSLTDQS